MKRIHIVGRKNHGKTTLLVALVEELCRLGVRVGSIKHSPHTHEPDVPGKDSFRHRQAGAAPAAFVNEQWISVHLPRPADVYPALEAVFAGCDLVLVEGDLEGEASHKIEVWRAEGGPNPLAAHRRDITAVITDDPLDLPLPVWPRADVPAIAERLLGWVR